MIRNTLLRALFMLFIHFLTLAKVSENLLTVSIQRALDLNLRVTICRFADYTDVIERVNLVDMADKLLFSVFSSLLDIMDVDLGVR